MAEQWGVRPYPNLVDEFEIVSGDDADYEHIADIHCTDGQDRAYLIASAPLLKDALMAALDQTEDGLHSDNCDEPACWVTAAKKALLSSVPPTAAAGASADAGGQALSTTNQGEN